MARIQASSRHRSRSESDSSIRVRHSQTRRSRPVEYGTDAKSDDSDAEYRRRSVSRRRSSDHTFTRAVDEDGNELTIDVPLQSAEGLASFLPTKKIPRQTTLRQLQLDGELARRYHCEKIERMDVLSSHRYSTEGRESAVLRYKMSSSEGPSRQFRWMYA